MIFKNKFSIFVCVCVCKCTNMKKQGFPRIILFIVELFANVKHFGFYIKLSSSVLK